MGEPDRTLYILQSGQVDVVVKGPGTSKVIATIGAGIGILVNSHFSMARHAWRQSMRSGTAREQLLALSDPAFIRFGLSSAY